MRGMRIFGEIAINNQLVEMGDMKKYSAYVQQDDLFIAEMTVQEHLMFAARLRMPSTLSETKRKETVEDVITMVVAALKVLASKGKTVISTIHQPSSQVYELADSIVVVLIMLLINQLVEVNTNGTRTSRLSRDCCRCWRLLRFDNFSDSCRLNYYNLSRDVHAMSFVGFCSYSRPMYTSLPDHFMKVLSRGENDTEQNYIRRVEEIIELFESSDAAKYAHYLTHVKVSSAKRNIKYVSGVGKGYSAPCLVQLWWLFVRSSRTIIRNPIVLRVRLFQISVFIAELPVVIREYQANTYSPIAYFIAVNAADVSFHSDNELSSKILR
ncbi:hypothetical protein ANCCAN_22052 [Ancylostoma caninum]|uniref:ABC transporter family G domain-containing protein n=1 Tax=Ancylostoma caninum TaxID=29170 RepID=A0A368FPN7_ANCCA|nr:hypothetical protein ANCCAN_22052 [Ancylostoma caninum]